MKQSMCSDHMHTDVTEMTSIIMLFLTSKSPECLSNIPPLLLANSFGFTSIYFVKSAFPA